MELNAFLDRCDCAPLEFDEVAEDARQVTDCKELAKAAKQYLKCKAELERALDEIGFTFG